MTTALDARATPMRRHVLPPDMAAGILARWLDDLLQTGPTAFIDRAALDDICTGLLEAVAQAIETPHANTAQGDNPRSDATRLGSASPGGPLQVPPDMAKLLSSVSSNLGERGLSPSQTAGFIFSLRRHLHPVTAAAPAVQQRLGDLIDAMGVYLMDAFIQRREQVLMRQAQELLDTSVPVVPLWDGILSLPIIGTLDSGRAQAITEKLLFELARTNSRHAILDISGVPTVDTQTAQYLGRTVAAARLMGAECVITGIRPAIAQVMVALGINLASMETRFSLADGLRYCFAKQGLSVKRHEA